MHMSKESKMKSQTTTLAFDQRDYWVMDEQNSSMANAVIDELMKRFEVSPEELVDFMYNLKTVKTHGYGHVQVYVFDGKIQKSEALIRTIHAVEREVKEK